MSDIWIRADIQTTTAGIEPVGAVLLEICPGGYSVQDSADFEEFLAGKAGHWDYIDSELMGLRGAPTILSVYLADNEQGRENLGVLKSELLRLQEADVSGEWGCLSLALADVHEQDWETAWKQYYKPVKIGDRLVVCPSWESYDPLPHETVMQLDPGMAFGTGTHETTRLCLRMLDRFDPHGKSVLDIGCGSGILSVAATLFGARSALGIDIDEMAVGNARENAALNSADITFCVGDLARDVSGQYDIIFANIVAGALVKLAPAIPSLLANGGVFIAGGIIANSEQDVHLAFENAGLRIIHRESENDWVSLVSEIG